MNLHGHVSVLDSSILALWLAEIKRVCMLVLYRGDSMSRSGVVPRSSARQRSTYILHLDRMPCVQCTTLDPPDICPRFKRSPILDCRAYTPYTVPKLIPVLGSQPACEVSHKPGGRLPLLSTRRAVTLATLKKAATNFAALIMYF